MKDSTTDRELLELAAKAANEPLQYDTFGQSADAERVYCYWNPRTDDGDCARMEAALSLNVQWYPAMVLVGPEKCGPTTGIMFAEYFDNHDGDKNAARRLASTRAAAEIGRSQHG
jgi:hypothetical protein